MRRDVTVRAQGIKTVLNGAPGRAVLGAWLLIVAAAAVVVAGQAQTGTIAGVVTESDGGVVPGAAVTLTGGHVQRKAVSNRLGRFEFSDLPPSTYRVVVRLAGFLSAAENLSVEVGRRTEWTVRMYVASSRRAVPAEGPDPTDPGLSRAVYVAVLDEVFRREVPGRLVVQKESVPLPEVIEEDWTGQLAGVPAELRVQLAPGAGQRSVTHNNAAFASGTQLVPRAEIDTVFSGSFSDWWARFRDRFGTSSYQAFSRVLQTTDGLHALVEYRHHCGSLCGEGALAWFSRADRRNAWRLRGRGFFWVS